MATVNKASINRAIKHLGLEVQNKRGAGYSYFTDFEGNQVGGSVMVCYLYEMPVERWVAAAEDAAKERDAAASPKAEFTMKFRRATPETSKE